MTAFDERERAFEAQYAHDREMLFKAEARRNKLLGLWAASLMGLSGLEAEAYAKSVIIADFEEAGDEDVYRKVAADLAERGVDMPEADLRRRMREFLSEAKAQLMGTAPG